MASDAFWPSGFHPTARWRRTPDLAARGLIRNTRGSRLFDVYVHGDDRRWRSFASAFPLSR
jgi:hypothetical protein